MDRRNEQKSDSLSGSAEDVPDACSIQEPASDKKDSSTQDAFTEPKNIEVQSGAEICHSVDNDPSDSDGEFEPDGDGDTYDTGNMDNLLNVLAAEGEESDADDYSDYSDCVDEEEMGGYAHELRCAGPSCNVLFTDRAMAVVLCADVSKKLFSVDVPLADTVIESSSARKLTSCCCEVRDVSCQRCTLRVGYHVVNACVFCLELSDNNAQYWMFDDPNAVNMTMTELEIYELPLNHAPLSRPTVDQSKAPLPDNLRCSICCDVFYKPMSVCNGEHTFCRVCILREIDGRKCCPLDRNLITCQDLVVAHEIESAVNKYFEDAVRAGAVQDQD